MFEKDEIKTWIFWGMLIGLICQYGFLIMTMEHFKDHVCGTEKIFRGMNNRIEKMECALGVASEKDCPGRPHDLYKRRGR